MKKVILALIPSTMVPGNFKWRDPEILEVDMETTKTFYATLTYNVKDATLRKKCGLSSTSTLNVTEAVYRTLWKIKSMYPDFSEDSILDHIESSLSVLKKQVHIIEKWWHGRQIHFVSAAENHVYPPPNASSFAYSHQPHNMEGKIFHRSPPDQERYEARMMKKYMSKKDREYFQMLNMNDKEYERYSQKNDLLFPPSPRAGEEKHEEVVSSSPPPPPSEESCVANPHTEEKKRHETAKLETDKDWIRPSDLEIAEKRALKAKKKKKKKSKISRHVRENKENSKKKKKKKKQKLSLPLQVPDSPPPKTSDIVLDPSPLFLAQNIPSQDYPITLRIHLAQQRRQELDDRMNGILPDDQDVAFFLRQKEAGLTMNGLFFYPESADMTKKRNYEFQKSSQKRKKMQQIRTSRIVAEPYQVMDEETGRLVDMKGSLGASKVFQLGLSQNLPFLQIRELVMSKWQNLYGWVSKGSGSLAPTVESGAKGRWYQAHLRASRLAMNRCYRPPMTFPDFKDFTDTATRTSLGHTWVERTSPKLVSLEIFMKKSRVIRKLVLFTGKVQNFFSLLAACKDLQNIWLQKSLSSLSHPPSSSLPLTVSYDPVLATVSKKLVSCTGTMRSDSELLPENTFTNDKLSLKSSTDVSGIQIQFLDQGMEHDVLALAIKKDAFLTSEKNEWSEEEECCLSEEEEYCWSDEQEDLAEGGGYWDSSTSCYVAWS